MIFQYNHIFLFPQDYEKGFHKALEKCTNILENFSFMHIKLETVKKIECNLLNLKNQVRSQYSVVRKYEIGLRGTLRNSYNQILTIKLVLPDKC